MPALTNAKQEKFALLLAEGMTQLKAYVQAGYQSSKRGSWAMAHKPAIVMRIEEIRQDLKVATDAAIEKAAAEVGVDKEWVLRKLRENVEMARKNKQWAAANQALQLIGKEMGMFVEKTENTSVNQNFVVYAEAEPHEPITPEQWADEHKLN